MTTLLSHSKAGAILEEMVSRELQVNFTQTLDLRFLDKEMVQLLRRIRCSNTRFTRSNYHFSLNNARGLDRIRKNYELFGFRSSDNVEFVLYVMVSIPTCAKTSSVFAS